MPGTQRWSRWRFVLAPKWLAWHLFVVASVWGMLALGDWQLHRAEAGNTLSWAYTFEWPFFAILAVLFWAKTLRDEAYPPARTPAAGPAVTLPPGALPDGAAGAGAGAGGAGAGAGGVRAGAVAAGANGDPGSSEEDAELAAYNAYLARLHEEVKGHGKWHGWR